MKFYKYTVSIVGLFRKTYEIRENNRLVYSVIKPGIFSSNLFLIDQDRNELLEIKKPLSFFKMKYDYFKSDNYIGTLEKNMIGNTYELNTNETQYIANGNWNSSEYTIFHREEEIAKVSKTFFTKKDKYGIAIIEGYDNLLILSIVVLIDIVRRQRSKG